MLFVETYPFQKTGAQCPIIQAVEVVQCSRISEERDYRIVKRDELEMIN